MSPQLIAHFREPRNVGELQPPAITVQVENPVCGDILRLSARFENGRAVEVGYQVRGCTASIAAGSALTELMLIRDGASITAADIEESLGGLANESKHAAALCMEALRLLMDHIAADMRTVQQAK